MSSVSTPSVASIICGACQRNFAWKPELAGRRVKCKCGEKISVPAAKDAPTPAARTSKPAAESVKKVAPKPVVPIEEPADLDGLMALVNDADRASAAMPIETVDFVPEATPAPAKTKGAIPLGYQRGMTATERQKAERHAAAVISPQRDLYAPIACLVVGLILYFSSFISTYNLPAAAIVPVGFGVIIITIFKTVLLLGFAFVTAGPLGVSYGTLWTGILKLAAIAVLVDGIVGWVDIGIGKMAGGHGGGGLVGYGRLGWPLAIGLYWVMLMLFFDMDPGESRIVVACLAIFDRVVKLVIFFLLLNVILSWGGVSAPVASSASSAASSISTSNSVLATRVDSMKESGSLVEAGTYISDGHQYALNQPVKDWYAAGCRNVWFELVTTDMLNHKRSASGLILELPKDKVKRAKCFTILKDYYTREKIFFDPEDVKDNSDDYKEVELR